MPNPCRTALAAAIGITLAAAAMHIAGNLTPAITPPAAAPAPQFAPAGWRHYQAVWHWTAPATEVEIHITADGTEWTRLGTHQATPGRNTFTILIPDRIRATAGSPRLRIGTADRRIGFETTISLGKDE